MLPRALFSTRTLSSCGTAAGLFLSFLAAAPSQAAQKSSPSEPAGPRAVPVSAKLRPLLEEHCQKCHGAEKQKGKFRVDDLPISIADVQTAERWQKILNAMNAGEMPPDDEPQPDSHQKTDFLEELSLTMVSARKALGDQKGVIALRRLNRREYRNTLRDLLGVEMDVSELPADSVPNGFDTAGARLFLTSNQIETYEALAEDALLESFRKHSQPFVSKKHRSEPESEHPVFLKRNAEAIKDIENGLAWNAAVDAAAEAPENAELVAGLRKIAATPDALRYHWRKIPGAPSPVQFGFKQDAEINPALIYRCINDQFFRLYDAHYLTLPKLDSGAYLAIPNGNGIFGGTSFRSEIRLSIPPDFPPGEYIVRARVGAAPTAPAERRFLEFTLKSGFGAPAPALSVHHITGSLEDPQVIEIPYTVTRSNMERGHRHLIFRERGTSVSQLYQTLFHKERARNGFGPEPALWIDWLEIERQPPAFAGAASGIRALDLPLEEKTVSVDPERLRAGLGRFAKLAYRGADPGPEEADRLLAIYRSRIATGDKHPKALATALSSVLSSPQFLYRSEPDAGEQHRLLTGRELAVRLAYFLWGGPPDEILATHGQTGALLKPEVLLRETTRLLEDPRSQNFTKPFLTQWLSLDRLDLFQFSLKLHPRFDDVAKAAARQEVFETFGLLLQENRPLTDLLKADYAVVNGLLANYYEIPGVSGDTFRPVPIPPDSPRGGLLGMAAIMAMGGNGERTNPVERGAWVLRKLLNEPPPPAPANVPEIARLAGKLLTARERLQAHQEEPQCASCHRKIDPIGFGLENFDAVGLWRVSDTYQALDGNGKPDPKARKTWTIDPSAQLHKGPAFSNFHQLRDLIAQRRQPFARGFAVALTEYALGRTCGFSDEPLLQHLTQTAAKDGYAVRSFLHALVQSREFLSK